MFGYLDRKTIKLFKFEDFLAIATVITVSKASIT